MTLAIAACLRSTSSRPRRSTQAILAVAAAAAIATSGCRSSQSPSRNEAALAADEVVATVDGAPIRGATVLARVAALRPTFAAPDGTTSTISEMSAQLRVLDELIDEALIAIAAERAGVVVADEEIDARLAARNDTRPYARDVVRSEIVAERLAGAPTTPPSDELVEAYYRDYVAAEPATGDSVPSLDEVRERLRSGLSATVAEAARDGLRRRLRAQIPHTNELAVRYGGVSWDPASPPPSASPTPSVAGPVSSTRQPR